MEPVLAHGIHFAEASFGVGKYIYISVSGCGVGAAS
jgi:hypothetical protein